MSKKPRKDIFSHLRGKNNPFLRQGQTIEISSSGRSGGDDDDFPTSYLGDIDTKPSYDIVPSSNSNTQASSSVAATYSNTQASSSVAATNVNNGQIDKRIEILLKDGKSIRERIREDELKVRNDPLYIQVELKKVLKANKVKEPLDSFLLRTHSSARANGSTVHDFVIDGNDIGSIHHFSLQQVDVTVSSKSSKSNSKSKDRNKNDYALKNDALKSAQQTLKLRLGADQYAVLADHEKILVKYKWLLSGLDGQGQQFEEIEDELMQELVQAEEKQRKLKRRKCDGDRKKKLRKCDGSDSSDSDFKKKAPRKHPKKRYYPSSSDSEDMPPRKKQRVNVDMKAEVAGLKNELLDAVKVAMREEVAGLRDEILAVRTQMQETVKETVKEVHKSKVYLPGLAGQPNLLLPNLSKD